MYYNTYDVTELLQKGENVAGVLLGNGFYNVQGGRYRKLLISFGAPTLLFSLVINYEDGTRETIYSDNDWKYDLSPITFNCIYGEKIMMRAVNRKDGIKSVSMTGNGVR